MSKGSGPPRPIFCSTELEKMCIGARKWAAEPRVIFLEKQTFRLALVFGNIILFV